MRLFLKCFIFLVVTLICSPTKGDILVYNKNLKYWYAVESDDDWTVTRSRVKGYVIMDVTYDSNGVIESIDESRQIQYGTTGGSQWYSEAAHSFDLSRITDGRMTKWAIVESVEITGGGEMTMLTGRARSMQLGFVDPNEAAPRLVGKKLSYQPGMGGDLLNIGAYSLRLNQSLTKSYNSEALTFNEALNRIRTMLEEDGYPVPG